jgi:hypothetical protein
MTTARLPGPEPSVKSPSGGRRPRGLWSPRHLARPFPPGTANLLPGLTATRTGLTPAGDDKLTNDKIHHDDYVTVSPRVLLGARNGLSVSFHL